MDVQMPGMDGLEATAAIRKRESGGQPRADHRHDGPRDEGRPRALPGGRHGRLPLQADQCPRDDLAWSRVWLAAQSPGPLAAAATSSLPRTPPQATVVVFDLEEALTRCFNSTNMVREMIQYFFDEVDSVFPQMRAALEKGDLVKVGRLGHRMKGTVVYLGAQPATEAALQVERFCKSSDGTPSGSGGSHQRIATGVRDAQTTLAKEAAAGHPSQAINQQLTPPGCAPKLPLFDPAVDAGDDEQRDQWTNMPPTDGMAIGCITSEPRPSIEEHRHQADDRGGRGHQAGADPLHARLDHDLADLLDRLSACAGRTAGRGTWPSPRRRPRPRRTGR